MRLGLATANTGKKKEFSVLLPGVPLESLSLPVEVSETGSSYRENALLKAQAYRKVFPGFILADDSGLEVGALGGAPGILSARYGGGDLSWPERWAFLMSELNKTGSPDRTAQFRCVLCCLTPEGSPHYFEGTCQGRILLSPEGGGGFGYDPIFFSEDLNCSLGLAEESAKNRISHRARAARDFMKWWRTLDHPHRPG